MKHKDIQLEIPLEFNSVTHTNAQFQHINLSQISGKAPYVSYATKYCSIDLFLINIESGHDLIKGNVCMFTQNIGSDVHFDFNSNSKIHDLKLNLAKSECTQ